MRSSSSIDEAGGAVSAGPARRGPAPRGNPRIVSLARTSPARHRMSSQAGRRGGARPGRAEGPNAREPLLKDVRFALRWLRRSPGVLPWSPSSRWRSASASTRRCSRSSTRCCCGRCRSSDPTAGRRLHERQRRRRIRDDVVSRLPRSQGAERRVHRHDRLQPDDSRRSSLGDRSRLVLGQVVTGESLRAARRPAVARAHCSAADDNAGRRAGRRAFRIACGAASSARPRHRRPARCSSADSRTRSSAWRPRRSPAWSRCCTPELWTADHARRGSGAGRHHRHRAVAAGTTRSSGAARRWLFVKGRLKTGVRRRRRPAPTWR